MKTRKLANLYETANQLQLPPAWLKQMALSDKIPCLKIGKRQLRFDLEATEQALTRLAANRSQADAG